MRDPSICISMHLYRVRNFGFQIKLIYKIQRWAGLDLKATTLKKFMIFNITNPEVNTEQPAEYFHQNKHKNTRGMAIKILHLKDVRNGGKAVLEEIGPFAYR